MTKKDDRNLYVIFAGMGIELVGIIVSLIFLGQWVDQKMHWPGYATIGSVIIGFTSWIYHIYILIKQLDKNDRL